MHTVRTREQQETEATQRRPWGVRARWAVGVLAVAGVLMFCYLRTAGTVPVLSDGAGNALQAWDMLHGNLLLNGWWVTDFSLYTTELPQLMLVEAVAGLRPEVVHICAAMTYTLLVLLAALVARGRARGAQGLVRALLAAMIILAPEPEAPTWILQSSPDHVGTAVPVLLLLALLDWARPRWYVPVIAGLLLAWTIVADPLMLVVGSGPLAIACLVRVGRSWRPRRGPGGWAGLRAARFELWLAVAAVAAIPVALAADRLPRDLGGFSTNKTVSGVVPLSVLPKNVGLVAQSVLAIFGADWSAVHGGLNVTFALLHLAGVALVLAATALAAWRLLRSLAPRRSGGSGDLVADVLVIAVVANVVAYFVAFRITNIYTAHEIGPVASLGAALAGRVLGGPLLRARLVPVLAAGLACYTAMLGFAAARAQTPPQNVTLEAWLSQHGLTSGLAPYWQGTSVTLESGGRIDMVSVVPGAGGRLAPRHWGADMRLADAATHTANFVVVAPGGVVTRAEAVASFGQPASVYQYAGDTILVWHENLLRHLGPSVG